MRYLVAVSLLLVCVFAFSSELASSRTQDTPISGGGAFSSPAELAQQLDSSEKQHVRTILSRIDLSQDKRAASLLRDIWTKSGKLDDFKNAETFDDPVIRIFVARSLLSMSEPVYSETRAFIKSQAHSTNWRLRANAADALADVNDQESVDLLFRIALTPHRLVANRAIRGLGFIARSDANSRAALDYLIFLGDSAEIEDEKVRVLARETANEILGSHRSRNRSFGEKQFVPYYEFEGRYPYENETSVLLQKARNGDVNAQHTLGQWYLMGIEVGVDYSEAKKWLNRAANQGSGTAKTSLAHLYLTGRGVEKSRSEAERLLEEAAQAGYSPAGEILQFLRGTKGWSPD